jgi:hypothetical protein
MVSAAVMACAGQGIALSGDVERLMPVNDLTFSPTGDCSFMH